MQAVVLHFLFVFWEFCDYLLLVFSLDAHFVSDDFEQGEGEGVCVCVCACTLVLSLALFF